MKTHFTSILIFSLFGHLILFSGCNSLGDNKESKNRPNIIWLMSEDISNDLDNPDD